MRTKTIAALAALLAMSAAPQALAQVDNEVLERLKAVLAEQQIQIEWEATDVYDNAQGDEVTALLEVRLKAAGGPEVVVPAIEIAGVQQIDIGWKLGSLEMPSYSMSDSERSFYVNNVRAEGVLVPAEGQKLPYGGMTAYQNVSVSEIGLDIKGAEVLRMNDFHVEMTSPEDGSPLEYSGALEALSIDFTTMPDPQTRGILEALGYLKMEGFLEMGGSWNPADGQLDMSQFDLTVNDAGTLGFALSLGGYTTAFLEQLQAMQTQLTSNPGGDNSAAGMAMLGLMQQLTFNSASISFFDDTLTSKVIGFVASMQGVDPVVITNQAKGMVPFLMMQLNNPELTNMVTTAVTKFLDDPKSLVIAAEPNAPVPFAVIMAAAMSAPQTLPQQLGVTVSANE